MIRRNRRPDWRRIKVLRSYAIDEAADVLGVHKNTVRHWIRTCGLPAFMDRRPILIHGSDLVAFLRERREARRRKCGSGQFYCLKCGVPRAAAEGMVDYRQTAPARGVLIGMCPVCETLMRCFVSEARFAAVAREFGLQIAHRDERLRDTVIPGLNCHLVNED